MTIGAARGHDGATADDWLPASTRMQAQLRRKAISRLYRADLHDVAYGLERAISARLHGAPQHPQGDTQPERGSTA